jgi:FKBP-type peptidyl-prolyl cis-trans isomerase SlyD
VKIAKHRAVAVDYKLTIDGGIVVDASEKGQPLWYLHGANNIIVGLERALDGLAAGDSKVVVVSPADGYGVLDPKKVHNVPKSQFPAGSFQVGDTIVATSPDGQEVPARIVGSDAKSFTVDFNHELAGKELTFNIQVQEVREASKDEIKHGHVHGPGGHHH